jgi:hypothetical protein
MTTNPAFEATQNLLSAEDSDVSSGFRRSMILFHHPFQIFVNNRGQKIGQI